MIEKIEHLESLMNSEPCQILIDGMACIQLSMSIANSGCQELITALENGRK